jgi:GNAT superfamily N-acetyltransferase
MSSAESPTLTKENGFTVVVRRGPTQDLVVTPGDSYNGMSESFDDVSVEAFFGDEIIGNALATRGPNDNLGSYRNLAAAVINETAKRIVGDRSNPSIIVNTINVFPEYQGRGVGSVLLREVLYPFESKKMVRVRTEAGVADEWFGHRGFYARQGEPVLESVCIFAVQKTIDWRRNQNLPRLTYKITRLTS